MLYGNVYAINEEKEIAIDTYFQERNRVSSKQDIKAIKTDGLAIEASTSENLCIFLLRPTVCSYNSS